MFSYEGRKVTFAGFIWKTRYSDGGWYEKPYENMRGFYAVAKKHGVKTAVADLNDKTLTVVFDNGWAGSAMWSTTTALVEYLKDSPLFGQCADVIPVRPVVVKTQPVVKAQPKSTDIAKVVARPTYVNAKTGKYGGQVRIEYTGMAKPVVMSFDTWDKAQEYAKRPAFTGKAYYNPNALNGLRLVVK